MISNLSAMLLSVISTDYLTGELLVIERNSLSRLAYLSRVVSYFPVLFSSR